MKRTIMFLCLFLLCPFVLCENTKVSLGKIEKAMLFIVSGKMPKRFQIGPNYRNEIYRNKQKRISLAKAIFESSEKHQIDPYILVAISFREGGFKKVITSDSDIGERSTFQIAPKTERKVKQRYEPKCETRTYTGAAMCAAALFAVYLQECGSYHGAMVKYATGKWCSPKGKKAEKQRWIAQDRTEIALFLRKTFQN